MNQLARICFNAQAPLNNCRMALHRFGIHTAKEEGNGKGWLILYGGDGNNDAIAKMAELAEVHGGEFWQNPITEASSASQ